MKFVLFVLFVAIIISTVSAFYSVVGLTAIFPTEFWPIVLMGSTLELGKISATLWLHKYWKSADWKFKLYLIPAIMVLMFITAIGTYGYLSKAHLDQSVPSGDIVDKISLIDEKIKTNQDIIIESRKALTQLDTAVDQVMSRSASEDGASKSIRVRKSQAKEREQLNNDISTSQEKISKLREERSPVASQLRKVDAEVGPIKYIAALVYGNTVNESMLENAVRWLIILIVSVFDPLAVMLLLSCQHSFKEMNKSKEDLLIEKIYESDKFTVDVAQAAFSEALNIKNNTKEEVVINIPSNGDVFPDEPTEGQEFTRTDFVPPKSFTFNGTQWVDTEHYLK